jgi:hypothetical protein
VGWQPPIALCEVRAHVYSAYLAPSWLAFDGSDLDVAVKYRESAARLKKEFNEQLAAQPRVLRHQTAVSPSRCSASIRGYPRGGNRLASHRWRSFVAPPVSTGPLRAMRRHMLHRCEHVPRVRLISAVKGGADRFHCWR